MASDHLHDAVEILYGNDPDEFVARRKALAADARAAGDTVAAREIGGLAKPTRSAWIMNRLARSDSGVAARLTELAARLRTAERELDGPQMRALTTERRRVVADLTRQALRTGGQANPSATIAAEVDSTFNAALADPDVADRLARGVLSRAASWSGFGLAPPELTLVRPARRAQPDGSDGSDRSDRSSEGAEPGGRDNETEQVAIERRQRAERREAALTARKDLVAAERAVTTAETAYERAQDAVRRLTDELQRARHDLDATASARREARDRRRSAQQVLRRLPD